MQSLHWASLWYLGTPSSLSGNLHTHGNYFNPSPSILLFSQSSFCTYSRDSCLFHRSWILLFCFCGAFFNSLCSSILLEYDLAHSSYTLNGYWNQNQSPRQSLHKARWPPGLSLGLWFSLAALCKLHRKTSWISLTHHLGYTVVHSKERGLKRNWDPHRCSEMPPKLDYAPMHRNSMHRALLTAYPISSLQSEF